MLQWGPQLRPRHSHSDDNTATPPALPVADQLGDENEASLLD